jgi:drug/metabolite transporter (DMT)-like permease
MLLTQSYRHADVSTVAPFEYSSMLIAIVVGYYAFGDVPTGETIIGGAIVVAAGIFIILREQRLGLERARARKAATPQG